MGDDWDLQAVVRGCAASMTTANNLFPSFPSLPFQEDQISSFNFPDDGNSTIDPFHSLQEIYQEFCGGDTPPPATAATTVVPAPPLQEIVQIKPPLQMQENAQSNHQTFQATMLPQPIRPRRRKNQQVKMVRQMTQEELTADSWAWRKYGQKPIKGSPYPRNYYRCSTSKGCAGRKQVERSPNDPGIFVVTYTGDHTHPRPTHRSSLMRSRFSSPPAARNNSVQKVAPPSVEAEVEGLEIEVEEEDGNNNNAMIFANDDDDMLKGFEDSDHSRDDGGFLPSPWSPPTGADV